jgi:eukaryotic-like serine/threonine-protein kinase
MAKSTRRQIGKYQIQAELGRGGFGVVYSAYDPTVGRPVAVKVLTALGDNQLLTRFKNEAAAAGNLRHNNIVTIYDYGDDDGVPYIVMELLEGEDLNQIIAARKPMPLLQKVSIMVQVADGLRSAHRAGVVHRDVKPANIRLLPDGTVKLMDFGIARLVAGSAGTRLTRQGHVIGTLYYMAPEQVLGEEVDALSDIFAYGSTYYELLTGKHPFQGSDPRSVFHKITAEDPEPIRNLVPDCPAALERIVNRTLQKDRDLRYQNLRDVQVDTEPILIELRQERAESLVGEAKRLYETADLETAQTVLGEVFDLDPANREARHLRETIQSQLLDRLIRPQVDALLKKADDALTGRRFEDAIEHFESALRLDRDNQTVAANLEKARELLNLRREMGILLADARKEFAKQNLDAALDLSLQILERDPSNPDAHPFLESVRAALTRREKERDYREKLQEATGHSQVSRFDEAQQILDGLDPEFKESDEVKELAAQISSGKAAFERQQELKRELEQAKELLGARDFDGAIKRVQKLMNAFPEEVEPTKLFILAHRELAAHRKTQAIEKLEKELSFLTEEQHFERALAVVARSLNTYPAEERLLDAQRRIQEQWDGHKKETSIRQALEESEHWSAQGDFNKAVTILQRRFDEFPGETRLESALAEVQSQLELQRRQEAIRKLGVEAREHLTAHRFQSGLDLLDAGLIHYGGDQELSDLRNQILSAKVEWERTEEIRQIVESSDRSVAKEELTAAQRVLEAGLERFPDEAHLIDALTAVQERLLEKQRRDAAIEAVCAEARAHLESNEFQQALSLISQAESDHGSDHRLTAEREEVLRGEAEWKKAEDIRHSLAQANSHLKSGMPANALEVLDEALKRNANEPTLLQAQAAAKRELEIDALANQARSQIAIHAFDSAIGALEGGVKQFGDDSRLVALRTEVETARSDWERHTAIAEAIATSKQLVSKAAHEEAIALLQSALKSYGDDPTIVAALQTAQTDFAAHKRGAAIAELCAKAQAEMDKKGFDQALTLLNRALKEYPNDNSLSAMRKEALTAKAEWERAESIRQALAKADSAILAQDYAGAVSSLESSLKRHPSDPQLTQALKSAGEALAGQRRQAEIRSLCEQIQGVAAKGNFAQALKLADRGLRGYDKHPQLVQSREAVLAAQKKASSEEDIKATLNSAQARLAQGKPGVAAELLQAALRRHPDNAQITEALQNASKAAQELEREEALASLIDQVQHDLRSREFDKALKQLATGLKEHGPNDRLSELHAKALSEQKDWQREQEIRQAIDKARRQIDAGKPDEAIALLDRTASSFWQRRKAGAAKNGGGAGACEPETECRNRTRL